MGLGIPAMTDLPLPERKILLHLAELRNHVVVRPATRYAPIGAAHVAFQVSGDGPIDLLFIPEFATHVELMWDEPQFARVLERLQAFGRLITFDKPGSCSRLLPDQRAVSMCGTGDCWQTSGTGMSTGRCRTGCVSSAGT
jgi:hypothetical protein